LIVKDNIEDLLTGIEKGAHLCGRYQRYAEDSGQEIIYTGLVVHTDGGRTYCSYSVQDTDAFFEAVNFEGSGVVSALNTYESVGWWSC